MYVCIYIYKDTQEEEEKRKEKKERKKRKENEARTRATEVQGFLSEKSSHTTFFGYWEFLVQEF